MTDDALVDVLSATIEALDAEGIEHAITGSVASSLHGEPYVSADVDIVVRMTTEQAKRLANALPQRFYRSEETLVEAARSGGMANLIDTKTGLKVDLSVLSPGAFHDGVLSRRKPTLFGPGGPAFPTVSPEDVILMKLEWRRKTKSQKQWDNALGVARVQGVKLDWGYLFEQADRLGITDDLAALQREAGV